MRRRRPGVGAQLGLHGSGEFFAGPESGLAGAVQLAFTFASRDHLHRLLEAHLSVGHAAQGVQRVNADAPPGLHAHQQHRDHRDVQLRGDAVTAGGLTVPRHHHTTVAVIPRHNPVATSEHPIRVIRRI